MRVFDHSFLFNSGRCESFNSPCLFSHVFSTYVPSGDSKGLLEALMATSPRKSPSPKKSVRSGSNRPRKSVKTSLNAASRNETPDKSTRETEKQTKTKKPTGRKSIKVVDSSEKLTQSTIPITTSQVFVCAYPQYVAELNEKKPSRRTVSKVTANIVEGGQNALRWGST